jgi:predicted acetyltransferase
MIRIAYAKPDDIIQIKVLWGEAFGFGEPYFSWYFQNIYRPERTLCLFVDSIMASTIQYAPKKLKLHGHEVAIAYIVGLCTRRSMQRRGYGHKLLKYALAKLRDTYRMLMLYTDIPEFYQPYGFSRCYSLRRQMFQAAFNPAVMRQWRLGSLNEEDIAAYDAIYKKMTADLDGYIIRDQAGWRHFFADFLCDKGSLYLSSDAYLLWLVENDQCKIKEIGYTDNSALKNALALGRHVAKIQGFANIIWDAPACAPIFDQNAVIVPHVMALSSAPSGSGAKIAAQTKEFFGEDKNLWVNEIT